MKSKPKLLLTDVTKLLNLVLFLKRKKKKISAIIKDDRPSLQQSMIVYQYVCRGGCRYVGRISPRLQDRINQHISRSKRSDKRLRKNLPNRECKITSTSSVYFHFAIVQHLLENEECAKHYNNAQFSILATARSLFHLSVLKATYIRSYIADLKHKVFLFFLPTKRIHSFTPNFTFISCAHFRLKQNDIFPPIKLSKCHILTNHNTTSNFLYFCINFTLF